MPDWSVKIVPNPSRIAGQPVAFQPDLHGSHPGDALKAQVDDIVTWNNTDKNPHWPWPTDANFHPLPDAQVPRGSANYLSDKISGGSSSRPSYVVVMPASGNTIYYCDKLNPNVHGTITVSAVPTS